MLAIAGLGNPGPRYAHHRHNAGFEILSALAAAANAPPWRDKFHGELARCSIGTQDVLLLRPGTFMNDSGRCVQEALAFFRIPVTDLVVVHDELDLPFGTLRLKVGGGHAGHNGLRSLFECLGSGDFIRLRVGIGRPPPSFAGDVADFVLSDFDADQRAVLPEVVAKGVKSLQDIARRGLAAASNSLNARPKLPKPPQAEVSATTPPPAPPLPGSDDE